MAARWAGGGDTSSRRPRAHTSPVSEGERREPLFDICRGGGQTYYCAWPSGRAAWRFSRSIRYFSRRAATSSSVSLMSLDAGTSSSPTAACSQRRRVSAAVARSRNAGAGSGMKLGRWVRQRTAGEEHSAETSLEMRQVAIQRGYSFSFVFQLPSVVTQRITQPFAAL